MMNYIYVDVRRCRVQEVCECDAKKRTEGTGTLIVKEKSDGEDGRGGVKKGRTKRRDDFFRPPFYV